MKHILEHLSVVPVPIRLKTLLWVKTQLLSQELDESGVSRFDLRPRRPAVVGQVVSCRHAPERGRSGAGTRRWRGSIPCGRVVDV